MLLWTVAIFIIASDLALGKPQGFGDNFLSKDFDQNFERIDFEAGPSFMPEFNFEGFFKKIDAPAQEIKRQADTSTFEFPKPLENYSPPTFYNGQRYSEITSQQSQRKMDDKMEASDDYDEMPYQDQSIRRLDGPYDFQEPPAEPQRRIDGPFGFQEASAQPKRRLLKVKLKKAVVDEPVKRFDDFKYPDDEDEHDYAMPFKTIDDFKTLKAVADEPVKRFDDFKYPDDEDEHDYNMPFKTIDDFKTLEDLAEVEHYASPRFDRQPIKQNYQYRQPTKPVEDNFGSYRTPMKAADEPEPYARFANPRFVPYRTEKPSYNDYRPKESNLVKKSSVIEDRQFNAPQFGSQPDFGSQGFDIPSVFRSNFEEPSFAQFTPPFGASQGFEDFLKLVGARDPFAGSNSFSAKSFEETSSPQKRNIYVTPKSVNYQDQNNFGSYGEQVVKSPLYKEQTRKHEAPAPQNGFFSNDFEQNYNPSTPKPTRPTTRYNIPEYPEVFSNNPQAYFPESFTEEPVVTSPANHDYFKNTEFNLKSTESYSKKPEPHSKNPESYSKKPEASSRTPDAYKNYETNSRRPESSSRTPEAYQNYETNSRRPESSSRKPDNHHPQITNYRQPIQPIGDRLLPLESENSFKTEPTVYYKELLPSYTPGPVYYKPIEIVTTTAKSTTPKKEYHEESVATAPKAPAKPIPTQAKPPPKKPQPVPKPAQKKKTNNYKLHIPKLPKLKLPKPAPRKQNVPSPKSPRPGQHPHPQPQPQPEHRPKPQQPEKLPQPQRSQQRLQKTKLPENPPEQQQTQKTQQSERPQQPQRRPPPPRIHQRKSKSKYPNLVGTVTDILQQHKEFIENRKGGAIAQSTAVLLPYVLSIL